MLLDSSMGGAIKLILWRLPSDVMCNQDISLKGRKNMHFSGHGSRRDNTTVYTYG